MAGNENSGRREKPFLNALMLELKAAGSDMPRLRSIAKQLIEKADTGDMQAIKEFADRLDGKPAQAIMDDETGGPLSIVIKQFVLAND